MASQVRHRVAVLICLFLLATNGLRGVELNSVFSDHLVLQRDTPVPVWGTAEPGEQIAVTFRGQTQRAITAGDGRWQVELSPLAASADGESLVVRGDSTRPAVEVHDVVVGEVWICAGDINAAIPLNARAATQTAPPSSSGSRDEPSATLRVFAAELQRANEPQSGLPGSWRIATTNDEDLSAFAYHCGHELRQALAVPVGIISLAAPGSAVQAWIRRDAIQVDAHLAPALDAFDQEVKAYVPPSEEDAKRWEEQSAKRSKKGAVRRARPDPVFDSRNPTVVFNGMIAPLVPFAVRGLFWWHGETITPPAELFPRWTETLMRDWRHLWGRDLPIYFCQLGSDGRAANRPEVRAWQEHALRLPATGMAVTLDLRHDALGTIAGHPVAAARLARIALARTYGRANEYSGPQLERIVSFGGALQLHFSHADGGLTYEGHELVGFEVSAQDGPFFPASAVTDDATVTVSSSEVAVPTRVRYAWTADASHCNLYNRDGLPAAPFSSGIER